MGPQKSHGPSGSDWRREWTVGRGADRLPAGGYHKATGWERLGKDTERADREEDDDGDNPRDPDDDANGDHTHLMQTQMGGSSSSGERETVPQGCLAGAMVRRCLRRLAAALTGDTAEHLQQQVEDLLLQMDPLETQGGPTLLRGMKRPRATTEFSVLMELRSMADFLPQTPDGL